jgi:MinD-like ATPase involved in chromosome partitioning or flagellar assembly
MTTSCPTASPVPPEIALVLSPERWVDALHRHCVDHGGARIRSVVLDPMVALDEVFDVLVTNDRWPSLTRPYVEALHGRGRRVLVVGDAPNAMEQAARVGADAVIEAHCSPTEIVACVAALVPRVEPDARPVPATPSPSPSPERRTSTGPASGPIVVVGGPFGAGSTEVAIGIAASCARGGARPVLVDADEVTPSVAARLGLPLEPNLCTAADAASRGLGAVPGSVFDLGNDWPAVLVGAPNRRSAAAIAPADVVAVGAVLAERFSPVVVDVSSGARVVHGGPDIAAAVLARATTVIAVATATPVGVLRLIDWARAISTGSEAPVHVVVNRAPGSRARRAELASEIQRSLRVAGVTFVPADSRIDEACWSASFVERGPFLRAIAAVCERLGLCGAARVPDDAA